MFTLGRDLYRLFLEKCIRTCIEEVINMEEKRNYIKPEIKVEKIDTEAMLCDCLSPPNCIHF